jgi:L-ascorbate metabolism protein UlaG (beta-lactamase superfamily)
MSNTSSSQPVVFLKPQVKIEPLACRWYAWPYLVAPAQLALNLAFRILPLLQSFLSNPSVHINANTDPKMYGGPFMDLGMDDVPAIRKLVDDIRTDAAVLLRLAQDIKDLDATLQDKATGFSLHEFYNNLPASLKGVVECLYDLNQHPRLRLFEALLYDQNLTAGTQEIVMSQVPERERAFFMSTPYVDADDNIIFKMRFNDPRLDRLARMRTEAGSFDEMATLFAVPDHKLPLFREFFSETPPQTNGAQNYVGDAVRVRYFGHACVLLQTDGVSILVDPTLAFDQADDGRFTFADLPERIDYVVLTHDHHDHFCIEVLIQLRSRIGQIIVPHNNTGALVDPSMKLVLQDIGFSNVVALDPMEQVAVPDGRIVSLPFMGEHADLDIFTKQALLIGLKGRQFMFLVDSDCRDPVLYRNIMQRFGPVNALFIGMECNGAPLTWLYEPLMGKPVNRRNNESRRLSGANCERATHVLREIKAPHVYVYAMGQEPWMKYLMGLEYTPDAIQLTESSKFVAQCQAEGLVAERFFGSKEILY